jgi:hypothetical protein
MGAYETRPRIGWFRLRQEKARGPDYQPNTALEGDRQGQGCGRLQGPAGLDRCHSGVQVAGARGASEIAKALKIGRASVYRVLEAG